MQHTTASIANAALRGRNRSTPRLPQCLCCRWCPSTTVVLMKRRAVCRANTWRSLDASGARWTSPASVRRAAAWPARDARRDHVSRERSAAPQPARGLAGAQTAPPGALRHFFSRCGGQVCGPPHRQQRIRPHRQRERPIPSCPTPHCILLQADRAFGLFTTPCNGPAAAGHLHDGCQHGHMRGTPPRTPSTP